MKKRVLSVLLAAAMVASIAACGSKTETTTETKTEEKTEEAKTEEKTEEKKEEEKEVPETKVIKWARGNSGNVFVTLAQKFGYFEEVGLEIQEIPLDPGGLQGVISGQVDIASNFGTNTPLQMIAAGDDMAIIGGFMMEGAMPVIAKKGTKFNGPEDFLGKKIGGSATNYSLMNKLVSAGHDVKSEITWVKYDSDQDYIPAVEKGELDFAIIGTGRCYQVKNSNVEIVTWCDEVTPNYSCCRMVARNSWVKENPTTVKLLDQALLRAQCYFEANRAECIEIMAKELNTGKEYVEAYMAEEEHYEINVDTLKKVVVDNWEFQKKAGLIDSSLPNSMIEDVTYADLYKAALDTCIEKYYNDDPKFWDKQKALYEKCD